MSSSSTTRKSATRPWRKESAKPLYNPLLPEEYLDIGTQRTLVTAAFVAIQAYKIFDLVARSRSTSIGGEHSDIFFVVKYFVIESAFLLLLPVLRIPWLTFTNATTMALILLLTFVNLFLSVSSMLSVSAIFMAIWKSFFDSEFDISGKRVRSRDLFDSHSHLSGSHIVRILPESTALFNPTLDSFCLESSYSEVFVPIRLNATEPIFIQMDGYDLNTQELTVHNFTKKDIKKFAMPAAPEKLEDSRLSYYALPISKPGLYRITKITDKSQLNIRLYRSDVLVSRCPSAFISSGTETDGSHRCVGDVDVPRISVDGVPPLKVKYSKSVRGQEKTITVQSVNSESANTSHTPTAGQGFYWKKGDSLSWASSQAVEIEMDTALSTTGEWIYYIDEVEDALGNVVSYTKKYNNREDPRVLFSKSLAYGFTVHSRPQISFKGCSPENPIKIRKGATARLPISIQGIDASEGPFRAEFEHSTLTDSFESDLQSNFHHNFTNLVDSLIAKDAGMYTMLDLEGQYCKGTVIEPATCLVYVPPEPSVVVKFESLEDKCAGSVGVVADLSLSGTPPFRVLYRTHKDGKLVNSGHKDIAQTREKIEFKPKDAGTYRYEFFSLSDNVYQSIGLGGPSFSTEQTVRALASASFVQPERKHKCCAGDSIDFSVNLHGLPPFKLDYEITHGSKRTEYSVKDIQDTRLDLSTPALGHGGPYTISLVSVQDSHGCVTPLNEKDLNIDVRRQRPAAAFLPYDGSMSIKTLEGRGVGLPLKLSGEGPWDVTYRHTKPDGTTVERKETKRQSNGETIRVQDNGVYSLVSVRDAYCPGDVQKSEQFDVNWIERPQLSLVNSSLLFEANDNVYERRAICENEDDVLELGLSGKLRTLFSDCDFF